MVLYFGFRKGIEVIKILLLLAHPLCLDFCSFQLTCYYKLMTYNILLLDGWHQLSPLLMCWNTWRSGKTWYACSLDEKNLNYVFSFLVSLCFCAVFPADFFFLSFEDKSSAPVDTQRLSLRLKVLHGSMDPRIPDLFMWRLCASRKSSNFLIIYVPRIKWILWSCIVQKLIC